MVALDTAPAPFLFTGNEFGDPICVLHKDGRLCFVNEAAATLFGGTAGSLQDQSFFDLLPEADRPAAHVAFTSLVSGQPQASFLSGVLKRGRLPVVYDWLLRRDTARGLLVGTARLLPHMMPAELLRAKQEAEGRIRHLFDLIESIADGFFAMDREWRVTYFNATAERLTGKPREEIIGCRFWDVYPMAIGSLAWERYHWVLEHNEPVSFEFFSPHFQRWFETNAYPSSDGLSIFFRDITARKQVEDERRLLSLVAEETVNAVIITDAGGRIVWVNKAFTGLTGYGLDEAAGQKPGDLLQGPETSPKTVEYIRRQVRQQQPFHCELLNYSRSGRAYWTELRGQPIFDTDGKLVQYFSIQTDISERVDLQQMIINQHIDIQKELNEAVLRTQERERTEVGKELHDNVNQVLTAAKLHVESIRYQPEQAAHYAGKGTVLIQQAIDEIRFLSKQLVTPPLQELGLRAGIEELLDQYRQVKHYEIELHWSICEDKLLKEVKLVLYRIIQEQVNNIVKYAQATRLHIALEYDGTHLSLGVSDNGVGFELKGHYHGIGLANIRSRAAAYDGRLSIESSPGKGCSLRILFPKETIALPEYR
ncbi:hypothetical protein GCM10023184_02560 [Flaviaesturariibacter amylovorans]|uniref:histidine kinase n=1 Tax=Flaviaesturariibacter amylovorans TaxID=1084520 RepID=A0ABP8G6N0_9BACT